MTSRLTVLVGNGVSIAYNPALSVADLTDGVLDRFENLSGTSGARRALRQAAAQISGTSRSDFEGLLGPLDSASQALDALRVLEPLAPPTQAGSLRAARTFLRTLHRTGLGEVLDLVARRAHAQGAVALDETVGALARGIDALAVGSPITVANLSYDGLVHAGILNTISPMADLATGVESSTLDVGGAWPIVVRPLRTTDDLPPARVHLLHLHGSLGWLRTTDGNDVKAVVEDLRTAGFWRKYRNGAVGHEPLVVLTDRKTQAVEYDPFALAYRIFGNRLAGSDRWLIAGYSFNDVPVNQALGQAIRVRRSLGEPDPKILVVGVEDRGVQRRRATRAIGAGALHLEASILGVPDAIGKQVWRRWAP